MIGLLTILGFSLYDTVVVYDKVQENTKGLTSLNRRTYPEAANLAVNQTLMRSINTSLIALLPVAGLLVAGVAILGSGTLKDLSLVMLIGMLVGAYSSVFIAVPIAVDLKMRDPLIKAHTARVVAKRKAEGLIVDADGDPIRQVAGDALTPATRRSSARSSPANNANLKPGQPERGEAVPAPPGPTWSAGAARPSETGNRHGERPGVGDGGCRRATATSPWLRADRAACVPGRTCAAGRAVPGPGPGAGRRPCPAGSGDGAVGRGTRRDTDCRIGVQRIPVRRCCRCGGRDRRARGAQARQAAGGDPLRGLRVITGY